jgi:hypothetical protein
LGPAKIIHKFDYSIDKKTAMLWSTRPKRNYSSHFYFRDIPNTKLQPVQLNSFV